MQRLKKRIVQLVALGFCFFSLSQAWAGVWISKGSRAFEEQNYIQAVRSFQRVERLAFENPQFYYISGRSALNAGLQKEHSAWTQKAYHQFSRLTQIAPYYGQGWFYKGLAGLAKERGDKGELTGAQWIRIKKDLLKGIQQEPGNAWMAYVMGRLLLSYEKFLSPKEKDWAQLQLEKAVLLSPEVKTWRPYTHYRKPVARFLREQNFGPRQS